MFEGDMYVFGGMYRSLNVLNVPKCENLEVICTLNEYLESTKEENYPFVNEEDIYEKIKDNRSDKKSNKSLDNTLLDVSSDSGKHRLIKEEIKSGKTDNSKSKNSSKKQWDKDYNVKKFDKI